MVEEEMDAGGYSDEELMGEPEEFNEEETEVSEEPSEDGEEEASAEESSEDEEIEMTGLDDPIFEFDVIDPRTGMPITEKYSYNEMQEVVNKLGNLDALEDYRKRADPWIQTLQTSNFAKGLMNFVMQGQRYGYTDDQIAQAYVQQMAPYLQGQPQQQQYEMTEEEIEEQRIMKILQKVAPRLTQPIESKLSAIESAQNANAVYNQNIELMKSVMYQERLTDIVITPQDEKRINQAIAARGLDLKNRSFTPANAKDVIRDAFQGRINALSKGSKKQNAPTKDNTIKNAARQASAPRIAPGGVPSRSGLNKESSTNNGIKYARNAEERAHNWNKLFGNV